MFTQVRTQDLLLQNQSMRLVEETIKSVDQYAFNLAKVRYLHSVILTPIIGTAGIVVMFYFIGLELNRPFEFSVWLALGSFTTFWRIFLFLKFKYIFIDYPSPDQLKSYLIQTTFTATITGLAFGWSWLNIYQYLSPEIQMGFLFTNIVMLFGGLYAYSPQLIAFVSFSFFSLIPALWQVLQNTKLWVAQSVGITLVIFVSQMFAYRWAQNFRHNVLLKEKNSKLLNELIEKKDAAEQATQAKSRFLATVSHDLRQPLHAINLYIASLQQLISVRKNCENNKENEETISTNVINLRSTADQLTVMFEALLDISKLDAESTKAQLISTSVERLIQQLTSEFVQIADKAGLTFETKMPANIAQIHVETDPIMLERILRNLLINATTHTKRGSVRLRLVRKLFKGVLFLEFRIIDTGPGLNKNERSRIFEEFYQTDLNRKQIVDDKRGQNLGLGLAISARLASLLKTNIRVHSLVGRGSVFAFALPAKYENAYISNFEVTKSISESYPSDAFKDVFIGIVEDDPFILDSTEKLLKRYGARLLTANSQQQVFEELENTAEVPDIFLIDHLIKNDSGITLIQTIHQMYGGGLPCILITGNTSADELKKFGLLRIPVLYKPVSEKDLLEAIQTSLGTTKKRC